MECNCTKAPYDHGSSENSPRQFNRPTHPLGKAISYALNQWDKQLLHLTDGHLETDNHLAENAVRPTKLGMKNWMFFGNAEAGWISACIYTLVENCKRQGLNPEAYIKEVLSHLPDNPTCAEASRPNSLQNSRSIATQ